MAACAPRGQLRIPHLIERVVQSGIVFHFNQLHDLTAQLFIRLQRLKQCAGKTGMADFNTEIRRAALLQRIHSRCKDFQIGPQAGCADELNATLRRLIPRPVSPGLRRKTFCE